MTLDDVRRNGNGDIEAATGTEILYIPFDPDDVIPHADGYCRFLTPEVLVVARYEDRALGEILDRIAAAARGRWPDLGIVRIPCRVLDAQDAWSARGNYVNFHRNGRLVLVPAYGIDEDQEVVAILSASAPPGASLPPRSSCPAHHHRRRSQSARGRADADGEGQGPVLP